MVYLQQQKITFQRIFPWKALKTYKNEGFKDDKTGETKNAINHNFILSIVPFNLWCISKNFFIVYEKSNQASFHLKTQHCRRYFLFLQLQWAKTASDFFFFLLLLSWIFCATSIRRTFSTCKCPDRSIVHSLCMRMRRQTRSLIWKL